MVRKVNAVKIEYPITVAWRRRFRQARVTEQDSHFKFGLLKKEGLSLCLD